MIKGIKYAVLLFTYLTPAEGAGALFAAAPSASLGLPALKTAPALTNLKKLAADARKRVKLKQGLDAVFTDSSHTFILSDFSEKDFI